jgi:hypothetical protein
MAKGYTMIVEPTLLYPLLKYGKYDDYAVPILYWLTEELYKELGEQLADVEMDVMQAGGFGTNYPAIGIYDKPSDWEFQNSIVKACDKLLRQRPISELTDFIASTDIDWKALTNDLMKDNFNPALYYRSSVRLQFRAFEPSSDLNEETEFRLWLEKTYEDAKKNIPSKKWNDIKNTTTLFLSAIGLLTFGNLATIPDILDCIPFIEYLSTRQIGWVLKVILPLPEDLNPLYHIDALKFWLQKNSPNLHFEGSEGKFVFSDVAQP